MRCPGRNLQNLAADKCQRNVLVIIFDSAEYRISLFSLITFITGSLTIKLPGLTIVIRDIPVTVPYLKNRSKSVLTVLCNSKNLVVIGIKHPLAIDGPIPSSISILLHTDLWRMTVITGFSLLTMIDSYLTTLSEDNVITDHDTVLLDRIDFLDEIILKNSIDNSLK